jgi:hypothetical protein
MKTPEPRQANPSQRVDAAASRPYLELAARSQRELEEAFLRGHMPDLDALVGWEFRGMNTALVARLARTRKFVKGFERRDDGLVFGYNRPVEQNRPSEPWHPGDKRFGWFRVTPVDPTARDNTYLHAALLDYGRGGNRRWDPSGGLRDYLVQVDAANRDLYLGKAYYALGPARVPISFFVLERLRPA